MSDYATAEFVPYSCALDFIAAAYGMADSTAQAGALLDFFGLQDKRHVFGARRDHSDSDRVAGRGILGHVFLWCAGDDKTAAHPADQQEREKHCNPL